MSPTVSPHECSTSEAIEEVNEGHMAGGEDNETITKEAVNLSANRQMMPVDEESNESIPVKVLPSPVPPSRQEMLEHNITHTPYRSWCPHCVAGKAKCTRHSQGQGLEHSEVPVLCMDYMLAARRSAWFKMLDLSWSFSVHLGFEL